VLVLASVTDSLVTFATHVINHLGLPGVFLLVGADAMGIPIAAAAIMLFAGFNVADAQSSHHFTLLGVVAAGVLGDLAGSVLAYAIGAFGRTELLERHGRKLHITRARLALAERWFERWGVPVVAVGRVVPFVRTYIAYPAGAARMSFPRFVAATLLGGLALCLSFGLIGKAVGHNWVNWKDKLGYVDYLVVALIVAAIAYLVLRRRSRAADAPA